MYRNICVTLKFKQIYSLCSLEAKQTKIKKSQNVTDRILIHIK